MRLEECLALGRYIVLGHNGFLHNDQIQHVDGSGGASRGNVGVLGEARQERVEGCPIGNVCQLSKNLDHTRSLGERRSAIIATLDVQQILLRVTLGHISQGVHRSRATHDASEIGHTGHGSACAEDTLAGLGHEGELERPFAVTLSFKVFEDMGSVEFPCVELNQSHLLLLFG